jgi:Protein of unknown function (DUF1348)
MKESRSEKVALAYSVDSAWRNRVEFPKGREEIIQFLTGCLSRRRYSCAGEASAGASILSVSLSTIGQVISASKKRV